MHRRASGDDELAQLERDIADVGYYSFITTSEEAERLACDEPGRDELLHNLMNERVDAWMKLATERLTDGNAPLYLIPGNDDEFVIDPILDQPGIKPVNADGKVLDIPGDLQLLASGWSNHTPWQTPREESEDELYARLDALAQQVRDPRKAVFMIHVPPYDSGLDTAPLLNENLRPTISAGDVLRGPVGSTAVRRLIETYQPLLTDPRPHPRVRRRAQDRQDALHQSRQRGQPRDPPRLRRRHRPEGRRARPARRGLGRGPAEAHRRDRQPLGGRHEPVDRHELVDHVRDADPVGIEPGRPVADRGDPRQLRQGRPVVPGVEAAQRALGRPTSSEAPRMMSTIGSSARSRTASPRSATTRSPAGARQPVVLGGSRSRSTPRPRACTSLPHPSGSACAGRYITAIVSSHDAGYVTAHSPARASVGRSDGGDRYGCASAGRDAHTSRSDAIASSTTVAFSIALTAPPSRQSGWRTSACPGRPGTVITP